MYKKNILKNFNTFRENECLHLKESPCKLQAKFHNLLKNSNLIEIVLV